MPEQSREPITSCSAATVDVNYEEIEGLVALLPSWWAGTYPTWSGVGHALLSLQDGKRARAIFIRFSERAGKYKSTDVSRFIRENGLSHAHGITHHSLYYWARQEDSLRYDKLIGKSVERTTFGDMTLTEFKEKYVYSDGIFTHQTGQVVADLRRCVFYLDVHQRDEWFICDKGEGIGGIITERIESHKGMICKRIVIGLRDSCPSFGGKLGRPRKQSNQIDLSDFIWQNRKHYSGWGVEYNIGRKSDGHVNLFTGFVAKKVDYNINDIDLIIDHIKGVMCDDNEEVYDWFIKILAWIVQKPEKMGVIPVLIGPEGVGKTIILEWMANKILGMQNAFCCGAVEEITGRFGGMLENKRAIFVNETRDVTGYNKHRLNNIITDYFINMERKYVDAKQIKNALCFIGASIDYDLRLIRKGQRRIVPIKCADKVRGKSYYNKLAKVLATSADKFYSFLRSIDLTEFEPSVHPVNQFEEELIDDNKESNILFLEQYQWGHSAGSWMSLPCKVVYRDYIDWCDQMHFKYPVPMNWFVKKSDGLLRARKTNNQVRWIRTDTPPLDIPEDEEIEEEEVTIKITYDIYDRATIYLFRDFACNGPELIESDKSEKFKVYSCANRAMARELGEIYFPGRYIIERLK